MSSSFPVIKAHLFEPVWSVLTFENIFNVYWEALKVAGMEPYVTDVTTIFLFLLTTVCKTYVKKSNSRMLVFLHQPFKFKYFASLIVNLYIAELSVLFVGHGTTETELRARHPENPRSKKCLLFFLCVFCPPGYVKRT
jgi:hypothetical protein